MFHSEIPIVSGDTNTITLKWSWISIEDRLPKKQDSPIIAWRIPTYEGQEEEDDAYLLCAALHWIDGWDGEGWYDHSDEYGMKVEDMDCWIRLPKRINFSDAP